MHREIEKDSTSRKKKKAVIGEVIPMTQTGSQGQTNTQLRQKERKSKRRVKDTDKNGTFGLRGQEERPRAKDKENT